MYKMERIILHCDLNNFYASVETLLNPEFRDKPLAVCGDPKLRHGVVLAKSYPAKACGVKTGDTVNEARRKCPDIIFTPPHHSLYADYSRKVFEIYTRFTDRVEPFGLDECWLDVTASTKLFGDGKTIADNIREIIKIEIGLTASVGVSFNKIFAKLGSDMKKPDATTLITRDNFKEKIRHLNANELIMIGSNTYKKLNDLNIFTIGDLADADINLMKKNFGIIGEKLVLNARGEDTTPVSLASDITPPKSIGHGTTLKADVHSFSEIKPVIVALSEMVATRLRRHDMLTDGIHLHIKDNTFNGISKQTLLPFYTDSATDISDAVCDLFQKIYNFNNQLPVRMLSVSVYNLTKRDEGLQTNMFENNKYSQMEHSVDKIRERYGYGILKRGILLENTFLCDNMKPFDDDEIPFKRK